MEKIKFKKCTVKDVYISVIKNMLKVNAEGWQRMVPVKKTFEPTGSIVLDALGKALHENPTMTAEQFAAAAGASVATFNQILRFLTGMDLRQFIAEYRMKQIREWLSFTDKSMTEIAQIYGFKSLSAFSHFVERRMKETPVSYRRQHRPANYAQLYEWE